MKNARQSIWDSYAQDPDNLFKKNTSNNQINNNNSGNAGRKLCNGELRKVVAKLIILNPGITHGGIMAETGVTKGAVTYAIKKIQENGVLGIDNAVLERALKERAIAAEQAKELKKKEHEEELKLKEKERSQRQEKNAREMDMQIFERKMAKRARGSTTISAVGLADWNKMHYDPISGRINIKGCALPSDLPRRYPSQLKIIAPEACSCQQSEIQELMNSHPPAKAEGTQAGRRRIRYLRMF
ncbi:hypothetical protein [Desulfoscipio gibsoniae]